MNFSNIDKLPDEERKALFKVMSDFLDQNYIFIDIYKRLESLMGSKLYVDCMHGFLAKHNAFLSGRLKRELDLYDNIIQLCEKEINNNFYQTIQGKIEHRQQRISSANAATPDMAEKDPNLEILDQTKKGLEFKKKMLGPQFSRQSSTIDKAKKDREQVLADLERLRLEDEEFAKIQERDKQQLEQDLAAKNKAVAEHLEIIKTIDREAGGVEIAITAAEDTLKSYSRRTDTTDNQKQEQLDIIADAIKKRNELIESKILHLSKIQKLETDFLKKKKRYDQLHLSDYTILYYAYDYRDATCNRDGIGALSEWIGRWFNQEASTETEIEGADIQMTFVIINLHEYLGLAARQLDVLLSKGSLALSPSGIQTWLDAYALCFYQSKVAQKDRENKRAIQLDKLTLRGKLVEAQQLAEQPIPTGTSPLAPIIDFLIERRKKLEKIVSPSPSTGNLRLSMFLTRSGPKIEPKDEELYNLLTVEIEAWRKLQKRLDKNAEFVDNVTGEAIKLYAEANPNIMPPGLTISEREIKPDSPALSGEFTPRRSQELVLSNSSSTSSSTSSSSTSSTLSAPELFDAPTAGTLFGVN